MKIVLLQDVDKLGSAGEIVTVKNGYARNFLIPIGRAAIATKGNTKAVEARQIAIKGRVQRELKTYSAVAERIAQAHLVFKVHVGEENKMFGAVTSSDIAEMLKDKGIEIDRRIIQLDAPIKSIGTFNISIKLHRDVVAVANVRVEAIESAE